MSHQPPPPSRLRRIDVANNHDGFRLCAQLVHEQLKEWLVGERATYVADLAVDEVLNNIIHHAYSDGAHHTIGVELHLTDKELMVTFLDDGQPFNPVTATPLSQSSDIEAARIGGRGLLMLHRMADHLQYERRDNQNKFIVVVKRDDNVAPR